MGWGEGSGWSRQWYGQGHRGGQLAPGNHSVSYVSPLCVYEHVCVWISGFLFLFFFSTILHFLKHLRFT